MKTIFFTLTNHLEDKIHGIQLPSDSKDNTIIKNDVRKLVTYEECTNILEKVNRYISGNDDFLIERERWFVL